MRTCRKVRCSTGDNNVCVVLAYQLPSAMQIDFILGNTWWCNNAVMGLRNPVLQEELIVERNGGEVWLAGKDLYAFNFSEVYLKWDETKEDLERSLETRIICRMQTQNSFKKSLKPVQSHVKVLGLIILYLFLTLIHIFNKRLSCYHVSFLRFKL